MTIAADRHPSIQNEERDMVTFYLGDALMGIPIEQVEEINHHVNLTPVPHAPRCVRGAMNLRGDVVMVVDLRMVLGLPPTTVNRHTRNVVVGSCGEQIAVLVDRIGDVVHTAPAAIEPPPANVAGTEGRYFQGVYKLPDELLLILDMEQILAPESLAQ